MVRIDDRGRYALTHRRQGKVRFYALTTGGRLQSLSPRSGADVARRLQTRQNDGFTEARTTRSLRPERRFLNA